MKLVITADLHGYLPAWKKILGVLEKDDILAVAGDLFGTRYSDLNNPNYDPAEIRRLFNDLHQQKYLVYGNCDIPDYLPGYGYSKHFTFQTKKILMLHGDTMPSENNYDVLITAHTHCGQIIHQDNKILLNPGSPTKPRDGQPSYIVWNKDGIKLINLD